MAKRGRGPGLGLLALAALAALAAPGGRARSEASGWATTEETEVRLVASSAAVGEGEEVLLGLQFRMKPGWKIYWRSPGAAGFPPQLDWSGSENLDGARMRWPAPTRFTVLGFDTLGYTGEVVFPIAARVKEAGKPLALGLGVNYLVCDVQCIPYTARLALTLPAGPAQSTRHASLIEDFAGRVPGDGVASGLSIERVAARGMTLEVTARAATPFRAPDLYVEGPDSLVFGAPAIRLEDDGRRASFVVPVSAAVEPAAPLAAQPLTLTLVDGGRAMEQSVSARQVADPTGSPESLLGALALALLGGLILNLMPCVLPVLALKLANLLGHGGAERAVIRRSFLATAAGVVAAFLVLAVALI
ncbi:MAG: protein-disulfide reductase DsbD domain-containing protein, partial [Alphaproteobacteria bacterium]